MTMSGKGFDKLKRDWDAALTIADLAEEINETHGEQTPEAIAIRELERGFPLAVQSLLSVALHSQDERVRRGASNDIINHNLALMQAKKEGNPDADPLIAIMKDVTVQTAAQEVVRKSKPAPKPPADALMESFEDFSPEDFHDDLPPVGEEGA